MKKINLLLLFIVLITYGCNKAKSLANIDQDIQYTEEAALSQGIPGGSSLPFGVTTPDLNYAFETNFQSYLNQYNTSSDKVIHAKLKSLQARITAPANQNFDFLDTLRVYVYANGLPKMLAAYKYNIPKGIKLVDMDIVDQNLKAYFLKDSLHLTMNGFINALPDTGTHLQLSTTFNLLANPLN